MSYRTPTSERWCISSNPPNKGFMWWLSALKGMTFCGVSFRVYDNGEQTGTPIVIGWVWQEKKIGWMQTQGNIYLILGVCAVVWRYG